MRRIKCGAGEEGAGAAGNVAGKMERTGAVAKRMEMDTDGAAR